MSKGKLWCADLATVTIPITYTPKPVTLVIPYYDNPVFFGQQIQGWRALTEALRRYLSVIVVDDGSPQPAEYVLNMLGRDPWLRLFRIEKDVRWNWLAARNIGAHHAERGWILLTDMDHVLPAETLHALIYGQFDPGSVYFFQRQEHTGKDATPHSASFFIHRDTFWAKFKGYDETLSGHYGTDGDARRRLAKVARLLLTRYPLIRHEYQDDSSTVAYKRKQPEDAAVGRLIAERRLGWKPKVLSFPYHEAVGVPAHA